MCPDRRQARGKGSALLKVAMQSAFQSVRPPWHFRWEIGDDGSDWLSEQIDVRPVGSWPLPSREPEAGRLSLFRGRRSAQLHELWTCR